MELNGERWFVEVTDNSVVSTTKREKASEVPGMVGAPMPGVVVGVKVKAGDEIKVSVFGVGWGMGVGRGRTSLADRVEAYRRFSECRWPRLNLQEGEPLVVLSAMKMETVIPAPASGTVSRVLVTAGDKVDGDDLLAQIEVA